MSVNSPIKFSEQRFDTDSPSRIFSAFSAPVAISDAAISVDYYVSLKGNDGTPRVTFCSSFDALLSSLEEVCHGLDVNHAHTEAGDVDHRLACRWCT